VDRELKEIIHHIYVNIKDSGLCNKGVFPFIKKIFTHILEATTEV
jgi:hypothetical protein